MIGARPAEAWAPLTTIADPCPIGSGRILAYAVALAWRVADPGLSSTAHTIRSCTHIETYRRLRVPIEATWGAWSPLCAHRHTLRPRPWTGVTPPISTHFALSDTGRLGHRPRAAQHRDDRDERRHQMAGDGGEEGGLGRLRGRHCVQRVTRTHAPRRPVPPGRWLVAASQRRLDVICVFCFGRCLRCHLPKRGFDAFRCFCVVLRRMGRIADVEPPAVRLT